jgi:PncC family amidohydrolase
MEQSLVDLAREVGALLRQAGWRLATAESCSGGLVGHLLTEISGSSAYYQGGIIAYDNAVKHNILGVATETLATVGAVSGQCALEMAAGTRRLLQTEVGLSTTGIAGPGGGTDDKPVGLVFIALDTPQAATYERYVFDGDRTSNKQQTARRALELLATALQTVTAPPS